MSSHERSIGKFVGWVSNHKPAVPRAALDRVLFESIIEGLDSVGKSMSAVVLYHVSEVEDLREKDIAVNVDAFDAGLERIFGEGSSVLDYLILKRFKSKLAEHLVGTDITERRKEADISQTGEKSRKIRRWENVA